MIKSVYIIVNGPPLFVDIFRRAFPNLDVGSEIPKEAYKNILVAMEPNPVQENSILNYASKNCSNLFYLGPNPSNYIKLAKYREVMVYDVTYEQLRELQMTLGKVHMVANPAVYLEFPNRTKHQIHVYGVLKQGPVDYVELFNLSARVTVKLGLLDADTQQIAELEEYINHKGIPVTIKIIHTIDEYFKFFNDVDRMLQDPEFQALGLASNIPDRELLEYRTYRNVALASKRLYDLSKILLIIDNSEPEGTSYLKAQTLDHTSLQELHTQVSELDSIDLADDIVHYEKYESLNPTSLDPLEHHRSILQSKSNLKGSIELISNPYHLFIEKPKLHLFYGKLPIDYPWSGILDLNLRQLDELFASSLFQKSLLTCHGFTTYSNLAKEYIMELYAKLTIKSLDPEFQVKALFYPIGMTKHIKVGGKRLVYLYEPDTNPYCIYDFNTSLDKYCYNIALPDTFILDDISNPYSRGCSKILKQRYPNLINFSFNIVDPGQSMDSNYPQVKSAYWDLHKAIKSVTPTLEPYNADVYITELDLICTSSKILAYCIIHSIPIIINKCPLSLEYLGNDYPLFSENNITEGSIQLATLYLNLLRPKLPLE
jgi:hypothetical protein